MGLMIDWREGGRGEGCADARFLGNKEIGAHSKVMKVEGCSKSKDIISSGGGDWFSGSPFTRQIFLNDIGTSCQLNQVVMGQGCLVSLRGSINQGEEGGKSVRLHQ